MDPDIDAFFYEQVFLVFDNYRKIKANGEMGTQSDKQAAINTCFALYHFREHLPFKLSVNELAKKCSDYSLVKDVVNITKHARLLKYSPSVLDIEEVLVVTSFSDEQGVYNNSEKNVEIVLVDGSRRDLNQVMTNVINMWFVVLAEYGIRESQKPIDYSENLYVKRSEAKGVSLSIVQGLRWKQKMRFQTYNTVNSTVEPDNLRAYENLIFEVYTPPSYEITLNDDSGGVLSKVFTPTREECAELDKIVDVEQKKIYLLDLAKKHGLFDEMINEYFCRKNNK